MAHRKAQGYVRVGDTARPTEPPAASAERPAAGSATTGSQRPAASGKQRTTAGPAMTRAPRADEPHAARLAAGFASFSLFYESRDGKLCVFEDAQGHLTAVNSARLA